MLYDWLNLTCTYVKPPLFVTSAATALVPPSAELDSTLWSTTWTEKIAIKMRMRDDGDKIQPRTHRLYYLHGHVFQIQPLFFYFWSLFIVLNLCLKVWYNTHIMNYIPPWFIHVFFSCQWLNDNTIGVSCRQFLSEYFCGLISLLLAF